MLLREAAVAALTPYQIKHPVAWVAQAVRVAEVAPKDLPPVLVAREHQVKVMMAVRVLVITLIIAAAVAVVDHLPLAVQRSQQ